MAGSDWIDPADADFNAQAEQFNTWVQTNGATHGLSAGQISTLNDLFGDWAGAFPAYLAAQTAAETALSTKDATREVLEALMRVLAGILQTNPNMTDAKRTAVGITVRSTTRTRAPIPTTRPILMVDTSKRLQHTLHWKDETTPTSKAKPEGVMGLEIWCFLGPTPPTDPSQCEFVALDRGTPNVIEYEGADANKIAHYLARWVNTRGEKGPWSETASATIGA